MLDRRIDEKRKPWRERTGKVRFPATLELPLPVPPPDWEHRREIDDRRKKDEPKRGVMIIDFS